MKKRFRKRKHHYDILIILIILILSIYMSLKLFKKQLISKSLVFNNAINNMDDYLNLELKDTFNKHFFLNYALNINYQDEDNKLFLGEYISDFGHNDLSNKIDIYIYNTHQTENYSYERINEYNINETVLLASYMLREKLKDYHLNAYVETTNIAEILKKNNWKYKKSYDASRILVQEFLKSNQPSLIIDLHRDSSSYEKTTITINDVTYARVLFVVGKENPNYETNLRLASELNELIKNINNDLSRGISIKEGKGVNGIYNQDLSGNMILLEVGGQYNNIGEVNNTLDILSKVLGDYLNARKEKE